MAATAVFSCPSCAASLDVEGNESSLECPFCGSTVVIPEALRHHPEPVVHVAPPQIIIAAPSFTQYASARPVVVRRQQSSGCAQAFTVLITLVIVSVVSVAGILLKTNPGLLSGLSKSIGQAIPAYADITQTFGGAGAGSGLFQDARNIGVDGKGNIYVGEQKSRRIQKFDSTGNFVKSWLVEGKGQDSPSSLAVDRAGNVYVTMYSNILQYDGESGTLIKKFGANVSGDLLFEVKTLPDGNIIAGTMDGTLIWFDGNGNVTRRAEKR